MLKAGLAGDGDAASEDMQVACLEAWARTTEQDLVLAQALLSHPLGLSDDLSASLRSVVARDKNGHAYLTRQVPLPFNLLLSPWHGTNGKANQFAPASMPPIGVTCQVWSGGNLCLL